MEFHYRYLKPNIRKALYTKEDVVVDIPTTLRGRRNTLLN